MANVDAKDDFCPWCGAPCTGDVCVECWRTVEDGRLGHVIDHKYRIDALLAKGGMGRLYRGKHLGLDEAIAVKFLLGDLATPEAKARFAREAVVLAKLRHPGIVTVLDYGESEGSPYLVMELLSGVTLADLLYRRREEFDLKRVATIMGQVLAILEVCHERGVIHRDIKLENVMALAPPAVRDTVKLLDFGVAITQDPKQPRLTRRGMVHGTPLYMAPEQARGESVGPPADLYACGVMLYELWAGEPPFEGLSSADIFAKHIYAEPPPLAEKGRKRIPPKGFESLVRAALRKRADDRPTVRQLRFWLEEVAEERDSETTAERDQLERRALASRSRDSRALQPMPTLVEDVVVAGRAFLWALPGDRGELLRDVLAVAGVPADLGSSLRDAGDAKVIVLSREDAELKLDAIRQHPTLGKVPVLVIDLERSEQVAGLIKAGASDAALASLADAQIAQKAVRLLRRGR